MLKLHGWGIAIDNRAHLTYGLQNMLGPYMEETTSSTQVHSLEKLSFLQLRSHNVTNTFPPSERGREKKKE